MAEKRGVEFDAERFVRENFSALHAEASQLIKRARRASAEVREENRAWAVAQNRPTGDGFGYPQLFD